MKVITTTKARQNMKEIVNRVKYRGEVFGIGRRNSIDAVIMPFNGSYNHNLSDMTNIAVHSKSFDFLKDEPDIYSASDGKPIKHG